MYDKRHYKADLQLTYGSRVSKINTNAIAVDSRHCGKSHSQAKSQMTLDWLVRIILKLNHN